jgi:hypothetical protein
VTFATSTHHTARKSHRCAVCRGWIESGTRHLKLVGKWDGKFYAERAHDDCYALWTALFQDYGDPTYGMPYDLTDVFADSGERENVQVALDTQRGFLPHAVNRLEFRMTWLHKGDEE